MADTVDARKVYESERWVHLTLTNESDGTGESGVTKLDISTLTGPDGSAPTSVALWEASWVVSGFNYVVLEWDHNTNDEILVCAAGSGAVSYEDIGGKDDPGSTGGTGDIVLTTDGGSDGASYMIELWIKLKD